MLYRKSAFTSSCPKSRTRKAGIALAILALLPHLACKQRAPVSEVSQQVQTIDTGLYQLVPITKIRTFATGNNTVNLHLALQDDAEHGCRFLSGITRHQDKNSETFKAIPNDRYIFGMWSDFGREPDAEAAAGVIKQDQNIRFVKQVNDVFTKGDAITTQHLAINKEVPQSIGFLTESNMSYAKISKVKQESKQGQDLLTFKIQIPRKSLYLPEQEAKARTIENIPFKARSIKVRFQAKALRPASNDKCTADVRYCVEGADCNNGEDIPDVLAPFTLNLVQVDAFSVTFNKVPD